MRENKVVLDVQDLRVSFKTRRGMVHAVNGVSFTLHQGEIMALVGESGCGKSVTVNAVMGLVGKKKHELVQGRVDFAGQDLLIKPEKEMKHIRGNRIAMIFQDPMTSLNPVIPVGKQVAEPGIIHKNLTPSRAWEDAVAMLGRVGIPTPALRARQYPFQFSGGMRQRSIIAMSLMCDPEILIADEPTTALDVTIQAQILKLLLELRGNTDVSILLITHDLGVVAETCDTVAVMYAGEIVEQAGVADLFSAPYHPYTAGLMNCLPKLGMDKRMRPIPGQPPVLTGLEPGCKFRNRCAYAEPQCAGDQALRRVAENHFCSCWKEGVMNG